MILLICPVPSGASRNLPKRFNLSRTMNDSTLMDLIQQEIPGCICPTDPQASNPVLGNRFAHNAPVMLEM